MKRIIKNTLCLSVLLACTAMSFVACQKEAGGKYQMTDGSPTIHYVRPTDPAIRDSLMTGALLGDVICIVGDNLTSVQEVWFNDRMAILNINYITEHTLIVTVPRDLPEEKTNKIYFVNKAGNRTEYDFTVLMPAPMIRRIFCEKVRAGEDVLLIGDYFFDDDPESNPITVKVGTYNVPAADIDIIDRYSISFKAPPIDITGQIQVETMYGASPKSQQIFRDDRGLITGFEEGAAGGWGRPDASQFQDEPEFAISGKYLVFNPSGATVDLAADGNSGYNNGMICNLWKGYPGATTPLFTSDPATSILRFEAYVVETWSGGPMTFYFDADGSNENCIWNAQYPRGFWTPWMATGSYKGTGWETVSIPIADCKYSAAGGDVGVAKAFDQLTFSVVNNSGAAIYNGTASTPRILIDNVRVVPN